MMSKNGRIGLRKTRQIRQELNQESDEDRDTRVQIEKCRKRKCLSCLSSQINLMMWSLKKKLLRRILKEKSFHERNRLNELNLSKQRDLLKLILILSRLSLFKLDTRKIIRLDYTFMEIYQSTWTLVTYLKRSPYLIKEL